MTAAPVAPILLELLALLELLSRRGMNRAWV